MFWSAAFEPGFGGGGIGFRRAQVGLLSLDVGFRLHVLDLGQHLALADVLALLHQNLRELAYGVRPYVDVILGLNLT